MVARDPPAAGKGPVPWTRRRSTASDLEVYLQSVGSGWGLSEASRGVQGCQERECGRRLSQDEERTPSADSQQQTWSGSLANTHRCGHRRPRAPTWSGTPVQSERGAVPAWRRGRKSQESNPGRRCGYKQRELRKRTSSDREEEE